MKNVDEKSKERDSPKTPGGISKSLLTPIRRLGLSRKWKRSGTSPFVSPLASNVVKSNENEPENTRSRKRKLCTAEENENVPLSPVSDNKNLDNIQITSTPPAVPVNTENTPIRRVAITRKKCESFISSLVDTKTTDGSASTKKQNNSELLEKQSLNNFSTKAQIENTASKGKTNNVIVSRNKSLKKGVLEVSRDMKQTEARSITNEESDGYLRDDELGITKSEPKVPNLSKECIVVIQKRILKPVREENYTANNSATNKDNSISQVLFDSDSDDTPLSHLNKTDTKQKCEIIDKETLDGDFIDTKIDNTAKEELTTKEASSSNHKRHASKTVIETKKHNKKPNHKQRSEQILVGKSSQKLNDFDDDDDDFEFNRKTILVRKSYDKVVKPSKSKSTGSITQKDIDELKARIEMKKKLLIAKAMSNDTEELRSLIKKWQKGCQEALMELLDLMKEKLPDHSNMNYSYILEMLKIPPSLVGYDEENECFNTPDDNSILGVAFNEI
ncbi:unnamed protein product, partial [Iphiclides podalirius]